MSFLESQKQQAVGRQSYTHARTDTHVEYGGVGCPRTSNLLTSPPALGIQRRSSHLLQP
jgi:hypothetical protein